MDKKNKAMKVLNLIWKFGTGGIAKCFLTYATLQDTEQSLKIISVCIDPQNCNYDRKPLKRIGARIIIIKNSTDFSWMSQLHQLIKETSPDLIFCHGFNGPIVTTLLKLRYKINIPLICSYHGAYYAPTPQKKCLEAIFNNWMYFFYKHIAKKIIVVSKYSEQELIKKHIPQKKLAVVHNGIKDIRIRTNKENKIVHIGVVSRLDPFKGIDILIKALHIVKAQTSIPFFLDIVGNGPMEMELKQAIKKANLQDIVNFAGYQANIPEWIEKWDIFCLPSFFENHSLSILEAMRGGKAIITTQVGGNEESVTNGKEALLVPAKDHNALSKALLKLIESKSLREELGKKARSRFLKEFTEDIMKRNLSEILKSTLYLNQ
ncbi:glycosyltransferase [Phocaeicola coprophilus]|uniref:glycosyltransferase n=1 Tax=Phocaeicola coprophilus TaxID=387090 RepID=UPI003076A1EA